MDTSLPGRLSGWEVHGFRSMEDLDVANIVKEASGRWLRPNEIHAILSNYTCFTINVKPVNLPKGGTIVLFDRKMLRNFRKDGHNWKKKKDGKTVKEAHEHLKVGSEERIHVYYAHGQDNPKFVRRCYWLLDKALEHVVLVHYRETQEGSPFTPLNSHSGSELSDLSPSQLLSEETGSEDYNVCYAGTEEQLQPDDSVDVRDHAMRLHEINSVDWDELLALNDPTYSSVPAGVGTGYFQPSDQYCMANVKDNGSNVSTSNLEAEMLSLGNPMESLTGIGPEHVSNTANMLFQTFDGQINSNEQNRVSEVGMAETGDVLKNLAKEDLQTQDSFGSWINDIVIPASVKDPNFDSSVSISHQSFLSPTMTNHESPIPQQIFCITDISPTWACTSEETKILVIGYFYEEYQHLAKSTLFCICGEICVPAQAVQPGVFRCLISPHGSGSVNFYLSIDRCKPISQILTFELRSPIYNYVDVGEYKSKWEEFRVQMRLAVLLFSTSKYHDILSVKLSENALKEAKKFSLKTSNIANSWAYLIKLMENGNIPFSQAKDSLFELTLKNRLIEWLFERIVDGSKISERDVQGQGVLHLCAILGYTWAVYPFSLSGLSIDFRDKFGWTALHWAAYYGREKMVAALLSAGAKPNLVTDPTSENPGGCTAANLASQKGCHGLAAYLSEKALVQQFKDMKMAGNASGSLETVTYTSVDPSNFDEEDIYLKDTLAAYRTVADAAARIQAAFREHSLKQRTKAVRYSKPEIEARYIIAAMKIQHAFRNYERRKTAAAAHIQHRFRTWKLRKEFLNLRRQAIKIQAIFRGFQVRKQYRKILWSVGVLEKAVLRWRMKRRGFRGLQIGPSEALVDQKQESDTEEDFFQASRRQAEEHVVKAVVCVQSMFRSKQAQEEYTRMKLAHDAAMLESEESQLCYLLGVDRVDAPEN